jgi:predicted ATP-grasp superfamily ATP-dependent carboligase
MNNGRFSALLIAVVDGVGVSRLPKLLHRAGCRVTLFAPKGLMVGRSRYVDEQVGAGHDADQLAVELGRWLAGREYPFDVTLIGDEVMLHAIAGRRAESWAPQILPVMDCGEPLDMILSKHRFMPAAGRAGLPVPKSQAVESLEEAQRAAEEIGFPVMLKKSVGFAGAGAQGG